MGMFGKSSNYKAAEAAHDKLQAVSKRSKDETDAYLKANRDAQKAYDRLSRSEKARFWR